MNELALFAGAGGGILGGKLLGWRTVCAVEIDPYAASVLAQRQNDGLLPPFPIWDDIRTFDGRPWGGRIDVVSGGFPCQDISGAGKGAGLEGSRSGLFFEMVRIIGEVRPRYVFVENSPVLTSRGLGVVLGNLVELGYDARWGVVGACDAIFNSGHPEAYHDRDRIWIVARKSANTHGIGQLQPQGRKPKERRRNSNARQEIPHPESTGFEAREKQTPYQHRRTLEIEPWGSRGLRNTWWDAEPSVGRVADGVACRVDRLRAIGNGQVPHAAALAWQVLSAKFEESEIRHGIAA